MSCCLIALSKGCYSAPNTCQRYEHLIFQLLLFRLCSMKDLELKYCAGSSSYSPKTSGATRWFRTNARQPKGIAVFVVIAIIGIIVLIAMCTAAACACMCIVKRATSRGKREVDPEVADSNANDNYIKQGNTHVAAANSCSLNIEQPPPQKAQASYPYLQANGRPPFPHAASEPERPLV